MPTEVSGWEQAKKFELVHRPHHANVQFSIVKFRLRSDLNPSAVSWGIGHSHERCGTELARRIAVWRDFHRKRLKPHKLARSSKTITAARANPGWEFIGAP